MDCLRFIPKSLPFSSDSLVGYRQFPIEFVAEAKLGKLNRWSFLTKAGTNQLREVSGLKTNSFSDLWKKTLPVKEDRNEGRKEGRKLGSKRSTKDGRNPSRKNITAKGKKYFSYTFTMLFEIVQNTFSILLLNFFIASDCMSRCIDSILF